MNNNNCVMCGGQTTPSTKSKTLIVKHDNLSQEVHVDKLPISVCTQCGSTFAEPAYDSVVRCALRNKLALMHPNELVACRDEFNMSQIELSNQTGIAVKTISQIENDKCVQSKSTDDHLRRTFAMMRKTRVTESVRERIANRINQYLEEQLTDINEPALPVEPMVCTDIPELTNPQYALAA